MSTTMINIKSDVKLKKAVQARAKKLGLPLSVIVNNYLRNFAAGEPVVFQEPLVPNTKTAKILEEAERDYKAGKNIVEFKSRKEENDYLLSL